MSQLLELYAKSKSICCRGPERIVRSRVGGFVTRNCCVCKVAARRIVPKHLPDIDCEQCGHLMVNGTINKNYSYRCVSCGHAFLVCDRVPLYWREGFLHCGVAVTDPEN